MASENIGRVIQVIGPVVDIEFPNHVPAIYNAINIEGGKERVVVEVEQHLGENRVRTVAMQPTDGMVRGMKAVDTGAAIMVPVGVGTLGRVLNVLGEPVDEFGPVKSDKRYPIHRPAPAFDSRSACHTVISTTFGRSLSKMARGSGSNRYSCSSFFCSSTASSGRRRWVTIRC